MTILTREDFEEAKKFAKDEIEQYSRFGIQTVEYEHVESLIRSAFIAGLNFATIRLEKASKERKKKL